MSSPQLRFGLCVTCSVYPLRLQNSLIRSVLSMC
uniref:Uncharacterized protein n=1 Tax=Anguilla anguilla TaxID=7936 RepID=A0A0E9QXJ2_ANGAN